MLKLVTSIAIAGLFAMSQTVFAKEPATEKTNAKKSHREDRREDHGNGSRKGFHQGRRLP